MKRFKIVWRKVYPRRNKKQYEKYKETARALAKSRIEYFNKFYGFKVGRIAIKNTKTRWGSASKKGNLNFNYKIALLPSDMADYVLVHELCHLGEFNHSVRFWNLVARVLPDYKEIRKKFKKVIF